MDYTMSERVFFLLTLVIVANCDVTKKSETDSPEKSRMMGVDAVHNENGIKIDKHTIITRNLKLHKKYPNKDEPTKKERDPDWSYSSFPHEVAPHVQQFKQNMSECLKEVQANDKRTVKRLSPNRESPVHGECLIACVLKRNGVILNGKINKDNLMVLVGKFFAKDAKLMKKLEKNLDRCIEVSVKNNDECKLAAKLNECTNDLMASNKQKIVVNY